MYIFKQPLKYLKEKIRNWIKNFFDNIFQEQKYIEQRLEDIQHESIISGHMEALQQEEDWLKQQVEERHKEEEIPWKDKCHVQWLKEGERNTKFFHRTMIHKSYMDHITKLEDAQGNTILDHE